MVGKIRCKHRFLLTWRRWGLRIRIREGCVPGNSAGDLFWDGEFPWPLKRRMVTCNQGMKRSRTESPRCWIFMTHQWWKKKLSCCSLRQISGAAGDFYKMPTGKDVTVGRNYVLSTSKASEEFMENLWRNLFERKLTAAKSCWFGIDLRLNSKPCI